MDTPFWKTLPEPARERLFALMRELDEESGRFMAQGREPRDGIPVGAAFFDDVLLGAARLELVQALRVAPSLEAAEKAASEALRLWVKKHNERRPKDIHWQRWTESGQDTLFGLVRRVRAELAPYAC